MLLRDLASPLTDPPPPLPSPPPYALLPPYPPPPVHPHPPYPARDFERPRELREVDIERPGTLGAIIRAIIAAVWEDKIPTTVKPRIMDVSDDFVRSYCMFTTFEDYSKLGSSRRFAIAIQHLFVCACALRWSEMARFDDEEGLWKTLSMRAGPAERAIEEAYQKEAFLKKTERDIAILKEFKRDEEAGKMMERFQKLVKKRERMAAMEVPGTLQYTLVHLPHLLIPHTLYSTTYPLLYHTLLYSSRHSHTLTLLNPLTALHYMT